MIEVIAQHENYLHIKATDILTHSDYEKTLIPRLEEVMKKNGKARVLFAMGESFHGWEPEAMWDDAKFGVTHSNDFEKCAVVGGPKWVDWATKLGALLISAECKTFSSDQLEEAKAWLES